MSTKRRLQKLMNQIDIPEDSSRIMSREDFDYRADCIKLGLSKFFGTEPTEHEARLATYQLLSGSRLDWKFDFDLADVGIDVNKQETDED